MLGLAMGMIPNRQVGLNKKGARRKNQNSENIPQSPFRTTKLRAALGELTLGGWRPNYFRRSASLSRSRPVIRRTLSPSRSVWRGGSRR